MRAEHKKAVLFLETETALNHSFLAAAKKSSASPRQKG